jgi:hypothetical protein
MLTFWSNEGIEFEGEEFKCKIKFLASYGNKLCTPFSLSGEKQDKTAFRFKPQGTLVNCGTSRPHAHTWRVLRRHRVKGEGCDIKK